MEVLTVARKGKGRYDDPDIDECAVWRVCRRPWDCEAAEACAFVVAADAREARQP